MARALNLHSKYLGSLAQKIGKDDLKTMLFHVEGFDHQRIRKRDREKIKDALSLFSKLQELGHINEGNCNTLVHLLKAAQLETLATEVTVRYEIGFYDDISDSDLKEKVNLKLGKSKEAKGKSASKIEAKPIGGTEYISEKQKLHMAGSEWTMQVLGSNQSGSEPGQFNSPHGLAWHGDQLVICDTENHRIQILNENKVVIEIIRLDGQFDKEFKPYAVAISPDGHFFITDIGNNQIIIYYQNKKIIQIIPQRADIEVRSITVMAEFIYITDSKGKSLIKYNIKDGKLVARLSNKFSGPHSVMATSNNYLLVSDTNKHVIHVLDSDFNFLNSYCNDRLQSPQGLDIDSQGNIYICIWESTSIVKLRSGGQFDCVLFKDVGYYPEFIAVNDDITTTIAIVDWSEHRYVHQICVYSLST